MVVEVMDLSVIPLLPQKENPEIFDLEHDADFRFNKAFSSDFRIRASVYDKIKAAALTLPDGLHFMFYEAYRPISRQISMWNAVHAEMKAKNPDMPAAQLEKLCENFIANPYDGIGSGHQACCAIDLTLCKDDGTELDMGTKMHEFTPHTRTMSDAVTPEQRANRLLLKNALEQQGIINYAAEWWHFSYGDHQWAWIVKAPEALYGPIILSER